MIEVREARYFLAVAQTLHFGRAAALLGMSQPPLSQAILQLERRLGARLLDRTNRKVELTETGRAFAAECRTIVATAQRAQEVASQAEAGLVGTLRIGVVTSALGEPLLTTIRAFQRHRPQVQTQVVEVDTPAGLQSLLQRDIDIAIVRLSAPARHLHTQPWRRDTFVIALPDGHPGNEATGPVDLARFAHEPWVWLRRDASPDYHDQLMATCHNAGFTPDVRHTANSIATQLAMVACGLGVTLVPNVAVRSALPPTTTYRPLTNRAELVELSLVTRDSPHEPLIKEFLRIALAQPHDTA
jgi:DNA-binding transcriptional LysR family regulator